MLSTKWKLGSLVAVIQLSLAAVVAAGTLSLGGTQVGSLTTQGPAVRQDAFQGGLNFWANWSLSPQQSLVNPDNLRWLQLTRFSRAVGTPYPDPPRPFVDPLSNQKIGVQTTDSLPWYDVTGPTQASVAVQGRGLGAWLGDAPSAPWNLAPIEFIADSLVILITDADAKRIRILGGVRWGYALDSPTGKHTTAMALTELGDTAELRAATNTALALDYPGWTVVIPEPASFMLWAMGGLAVLCLASWKSRGRRR